MAYSETAAHVREEVVSAARDQGLVLQTTFPLSTASLDLMVYYSKVRNNRVMTPHEESITDEPIGKSRGDLVGSSLRVVSCLRPKSNKFHPRQGPTVCNYSCISKNPTLNHLLFRENLMVSLRQLYRPMKVYQQ